MGKRQTNRGQTLVEVAAVLPLLGLAIAVALQLIFICVNKIELQVLAMKAARQISVDSRKRSPTPSSLWGRNTPTKQSTSTSTLRPWHPFKGPSTIKTPGYLTAVKVESRLLAAGAFGYILPNVDIVASAESPLEPPLPTED
jgi:hypothetical protein